MTDKDTQPGSLDDIQQRLGKARELFRVVREMRRAQREYFSLRKQKPAADQDAIKKALKLSIELESRVDTWLRLK